MSLNRVFFGTYTHAEKEKFVHGFIERTTTRCWNRTAVAYLSLPWQHLTPLRAVALFDLVYKDEPERTSAKIKIGLLQLHGVCVSRETGKRKAN